MKKYEHVSTLYYPGTKTWDERRVRETFSVTYAVFILAVPVPQHDVGDRLAWSLSISGVYDVKAEYKYWHYQHIVVANLAQLGGWKRI